MYGKNEELTRQNVLDELKEIANKHILKQREVQEKREAAKQSNRKSMPHIASLVDALDRFGPIHVSYAKEGGIELGVKPEGFDDFLSICGNEEEAIETMKNPTFHGKKGRKLL